MAQLNYNKILFFTLFLLLLLLGIGLFTLHWLKELHQSRHHARSITLENVLAYTVQDAFVQGDSIPIYWHSTEPVQLRLFRLGLTKERMELDTTLAKKIQSSLFHPINGLNWKTPFLLATKQFPSSYYSLEITQIHSEKTFFLPFIIKPKTPPKIAIIASTNTWQAYNNFGGKSNYEDTQTPEILKKIYWNIDYKDYHPNYLPFARPYHFHEDLKGVTEPFSQHHSNFIRAEWVLAAFLEKHQIEYGVYADLDLAVDPSILDSEIILFNTHSEYWSNPMMGMYEQFIKNGGKVIWASGNNMYRAIEYYDKGFYVSNQQIDPSIALPLIGTFYFNGGYNTYAPYKILQPEHWVFEHLELKKGQIFGSYSALTAVEGQYGASGMETDKIGSGSHEFEVLAVGQNTFGPAFMVFKALPNEGWIFNASSETFVGALTHDPIIDQLMLNLLGKGKASD